MKPGKFHIDRADPEASIVRVHSEDLNARTVTQTQLQQQQALLTDIGTIDFTELTDSSLEVETNLSSIVSEIVDDSLKTGDNLNNTIN